MAYVISHEYGHHIQTVLGISQRVQELAQQDPGQANDLSVRQELQADCLAGVWAHSAASDLEAGDVQEAVSAAQAVGDDRIQEATTGRIDPEILDPRFRRAARPVVHGGLSERQLGRLRHVRRVTRGRSRPYYPLLAGTRVS